MLDDGASSSPTRFARPRSHACMSHAGGVCGTNTEIKSPVAVFLGLPAAGAADVHLGAAQGSGLTHP